MNYTPFTPTSLFSDGAQGAWYDPSDINLNWRYNLLTYTEQFDDAAWTKNSGSITPNTTVAPNGTTTADTFTSSGTNAIVRATTSPILGSGSFTQSFSVQRGNTDWIVFYTSDAGSNYAAVWANTATGALGTVTTVGTFSGATASFTQEANNFYRLTLNFTKPATAASDTFAIRPVTGNNSFLSVIGNTVILWGASLTTAANASLPYQQIVTPEISYLTYQPQPVLYQDATGTTPVTAVEQPVGLMLDKSKGLVLGSELVTNGDFSSSTGWTLAGGWSISGGKLVGGNAGNLASQASVTTSGSWYKVSFDYNCTTGASIRICNTSGTALATFNTGSGTSGTVLGYFLATGSTVFIEASGAVYNGTIDNFSVKQLPGNHSFQTTAASRPVLSARYNLLTKTEQFDDAAWPKENATIVANNVVAPNGTATAELIYPTTTGSNRRILRPTSLTAGVIYEQSVYVKAAGKQWVFLNGVDASSAVNNCWFDLENGVVGTKGSSVLSAGITAVGNGWYRIFATGAAAANTFFYLMTVDSNNSLVSTTNGTSGVYIWGASLVQTAQAPTDYQRVNTSTDYDTVGFKPYLLADGVDDGMVTNSIDFTATDKVSVCAGVRKLSDGNYPVIAEFSDNWTLNLRSFSVSLNLNNGYAFASRATQPGSAAAISGFLAPTTNVISGLGSIAIDSIILRVNGTQVATSSTDQGTGNYGNYPLYLFRRGGTTAPFNGRFYGMTVVGKTVTDGELVNLETYTNNKTGAY